MFICDFAVVSPPPAKVSKTSDDGASATKNGETADEATEVPATATAETNGNDATNTPAATGAPVPPAETATTTSTGTSTASTAQGDATSSAAAPASAPAATNAEATVPAATTTTPEQPVVSAQSQTLAPSGVPCGIPGTAPSGVPTGVPGVPIGVPGVPGVGVTTGGPPTPTTSVVAAAPQVQPQPQATPAPTMSMGMSSGDANIIVEKGEVATHYVGRVIGKGGEQIRDLQARSGCKIDVDQNVPAGAPRVITYQGTRSTIDFAKGLVRILCSDSGKDAELPLGEAKKKQLQVPATVIGKIIGRGGEMIKVCIFIIHESMTNWLAAYFFTGGYIYLLFLCQCPLKLFCVLLGAPIKKSGQDPN